MEKHHKAMRWSREHEICFLREVLLFEPWNYRHGSPERGKVWESLSESLNNSNVLFFKVTARSLRDHLKLVMDKHSKRMKNEEKASGINPPEETEEDIAIADIIAQFKEAEERQKLESDEKKETIERNNAKAIEVRKRSLESMGETSKRVGENEKKKRRNNGSETIQYLVDKSKQEMKLKEDELAIKREENSLMKQNLNNQQQMLAYLIQSQQQQQQSLLNVISKLTEK